MITFNGVAWNTFPDIRSIMRVSRPVSPGARARLLEITGRPGAFYFGKDRRPVPVSFRIALDSSSIADRRSTIRDIADWLETEEPEVLTLSDEPGLRYYAVLIDPIDTDEFATVGFADVSLLVPAGYAESTTTKTASPNLGTLPCPVEITATMQEISNTLRVELGDEYILITPDVAFAVSDEVIIDTNTHYVTINGDDAREYVSFASTYFKLPSGAFSIDADPASTTVATVFRERFK